MNQIMCNQGLRYTEQNKWTGWITPKPWKIDSIEFDLTKGTNSPAKPDILG